MKKKRVSAVEFTAFMVALFGVMFAGSIPFGWLNALGIVMTLAGAGYFVRASRKEATND